MPRLINYPFCHFATVDMICVLDILTHLDAGSPSLNNNKHNYHQEHATCKYAHWSAAQACSLSCKRLGRSRPAPFSPARSLTISGMTSSAQHTLSTSSGGPSPTQRPKRAKSPWAMDSNRKMVASYTRVDPLLAIFKALPPLLPIGEAPPDARRAK